MEAKYGNGHLKPEQEKERKREE
jgi:hypothetical protein